MKEEFGIDVKAEQMLGWIESIFTYEGKVGHQLCAIWEVRYDQHNFFQDRYRVVEGDYSFTAEWLSQQRMCDENIMLYPTGLAELVWPK